jgi:hypothetical protein
VEVLEKLDDWTVARVLEWPGKITSYRLELEVAIIRDFLKALIGLLGQIDHPLLLQAKLSARVVDAPCRPRSHGNTVPKQAQPITIHIIGTIHSLRPRSDFVFVPLRSFAVQQQVHMGVADQESFARQAYLACRHLIFPTIQSTQWLPKVKRQLTEK